MQQPKRRAGWINRRMLMLSVPLCLMACAAQPRIVTTPRAACADLVPSGWSQGVPAAPVPDTSGLSPLDTIKAWAGAYVAQDAALEKANGRTADAVAIVRRCEAAVNATRPATR